MICRSLKLDEKTSHIPIILLTAKAARRTRSKVWKPVLMINLTKPFEAKELL